MLLPAAIWVVRLVRFVSVSLGALTIRTRMFGCSSWNSAMSRRRRSPPSFEATCPAHQLIVASPSGGSVGQSSTRVRSGRVEQPASSSTPAPRA